jgi:hypothetical protein
MGEAAVLGLALKLLNQDQRFVVSSLVVSVLRMMSNPVVTVPVNLDGWASKKVIGAELD